ncbi:methyltransferase domain-containing protein [Gillisia sp. JM1]|uniref:methyltransferase domain-containing protein n=1 Tax=Gillisia sp. JM1 TaxID=1283286 RepID=UPI00040545BB|nr:methyltransferase domain-containing protein [Gillisia sp. JM1]
MPKIRTVFKVLKNKGLIGVLEIFKNKFYPYQAKPIKKIELYKSYFKNKKGIEIGGPSKIFSQEIPIYPVIKSLDGVNFSPHTTWEGNLAEGQNFNYFENKIGYQFICEASNLKAIPNKKYDFLIASHCLEHCANALKTVEEWLRVIKKGGAILLILPDKRYTFDHQRPVTSFEHIVDDLNGNIDETDLAHLEEILQFHDLNLDSPAGTKTQFENRSLDNLNNRCLHHHVFDIKLLENIFTYFNIEIIKVSFVKPFHQIILGVKK